MAVMDKEWRDLIGDPDELERELADFRRNAQVLSSRQRHLIAGYPKQWVAIFGGEVAAFAPTLEGLLEQMQERGIPRGHAIIRYIDKNRRKMIL